MRPSVIAAAEAAGRVLAEEFVRPNGPRGGGGHADVDDEIEASALEGDARSAADLFAHRAQAQNNSEARIEKFIAEGWIPDFPGQTGEQKTRAHAPDNENNPTGFWEPGSEAADPPGSVPALPKPPPDE
jgi:hypothetical protein